jgi:two-component system response regulator AtoC
MSASLSVLAVDDDESNREQLSMLLEALGFQVETQASGPAALARMCKDCPPDVIILDVLMPQMDGVETLRRYKAGGGKRPVIMCSALDDSETVVRAMRAGAADYVTKPFNADELKEMIERVAAQSGHGRALSPAPAADVPRLGSSPAMRAVSELVDRVADADVPVLITGESGVGKDVVAREIHARSSRSSKVFIKINCAALPGELLESELFGHERGSFTGAERTKQGQFELADGGTLFLDEIGEMPISLQAKLLQVLQDGEFYRVGGQRKLRVDARVIVATNVEIPRAIAAGRFREDLYYRLNVVQVAIPPLRARKEELPQLVRHFVDKYGKRYGRPPTLPPALLERFAAYDFPGNVRELENLVRRMMVLGDARFVLAELGDAPREVAQPAPASAQPQPPFVAAPVPQAMTVPIMLAPPPTSDNPDDYCIDLKELGRKAANAAEREAIAIMLRHTGGDKREAAERLGISYKAILYKIRDFGLARPRRTFSVA